MGLLIIQIPIFILFVSNWSALEFVDEQRVVLVHNIEIVHRIVDISFLLFMVIIYIYFMVLFEFELILSDLF